MKLRLSLLVFLALLAPFAQGEDLRIGSFNIEWYPSESTDDALVWETIEDLNADLLVLQEIKDPARIKALVETKSGGDLTAVSYNGEIEVTWSQKLVFVYDPNTLEIAGEIELLQGVQDDHQGHRHDGWRPAYHAFFKAKGGGFDFHVIGVHMAGPSGSAADRRTQWRHLDQMLREANFPDQDVIILGDFNCYSGYELFEVMTANAGFHHITPEVASYCYSGDHSFLDNILVSDDVYDAEFKPGTAIEVGGPSFGEELDCAAFSASDYSEHVSDHLPIVTTFSNTDNDPTLPNTAIAFFAEEVPSDTGNYTGAVIGNKRSKIYHHPDSPTLPDEQNRRPFESVAKAKAAGYRAAKNFDWEAL